MKKHLLAVTVLCLSTTACFPVLLVGGGAAAGASFAKDSRSLQTISDDHNLQFQANQKLQANKKLYSESHIAVTAFNHIILLTGEVPSDEARNKAENIVQSIPNVGRVYNQLKVAPNIGTIQAANDVTLAANIKTRMVMTSNLNSDNFKVVVENGVVYLLGLASPEQTEIAVDVIRNSSGVKRVVKLVQYKSDDNSSGESDNQATSASKVTMNHDKPKDVDTAGSN